MVRDHAAGQSGAMDNASGSTDTDTDQPVTPTGSSGPRVTRDEMKDLGRLRRSVTDRHIGGVAGGLARHLDVDPLIIRVTLVVAIFFGGAGLLAYIGAWALVPEEGTDDQPLGLDQRNRTLALAGVGVLALLCAVGDWAGAFWFPWPLAIVGALVLWFLHRQQRGGTGSPAATSYAAEPRPTYAVPHAEYARPPRPRHPRRRGPILFFFTVALIALAEGLLGVADLAGADVTGSAYPALALGIITAMLLLGAFWGRAGGLIALGLVAALATAGASLDRQFPQDAIIYAPSSASEVADSYDIGGGELVLDLSGVEDVDALDGQEISVDGVGGRLEVVVPDGVNVVVRTDVVAGDSRVFDQRREGFDVNLDGFRDGGNGAPDLTITIDLLAGDVIVREAA